MRRTFHDENLREWEAYVSGGQPESETSARILFLCLTEPRERARFVSHDSRDVASAERDLHRMADAELLDLLGTANPLD
jgi:hypothetical protein